MNYTVLTRESMLPLLPTTSFFYIRQENCKLHYIELLMCIISSFCIFIFYLNEEIDKEV